jgi:hypothetical protein
MTVVENFSASELDPMTYVKNVMKKVLYFILQVIVAGLIISFAMKKSGLVDDQTMKTYMMYFVFGGISTYILTFLYLWYKCKGKKDIDYKKLAKASLLGPSVIITHIILLYVCNLLKVVPEIGILIYLLSWTTFGIVGVSGILYTSALSIAEKTSYC